MHPRREGGELFAADFLENVEKARFLRTGAIEAQKAKPMSLANCEAAFRDLADHRLARNENEIFGVGAGSMDLGTHPGPIGIEPRPHHRLDQHEHKGWCRGLVGHGIEGLGKAPQRSHRLAVFGAEEVAGGGVKVRRRQAAIRDRARDRANDMERIRIAPVERPARDRYIVMIAAASCRGSGAGQQHSEGDCQWAKVGSPPARLDPALLLHCEPPPQKLATRSIVQNIAMLPIP